ncbi:MAG: regulatory protein RecX [Spirochaetales bacterium]|nr:regulatory protein RecX [Spirochaetales bacterium]
MDDVSRKELSSKEGGSSFFQKCLDQAIVYLSIREHNRRELVTKLRAKGYDPETIDRVITRLEEKGSLSEERYVQSFIRSNNRRHPEGRAMLSQRLAAKGADRETCRRVLDETYTEEYTRALIRQARAQIERKGKARTEEEIRASLMRLGFSYRDIRIED